MQDLVKGRTNMDADFASLTENFGTYVRQFEKDAFELMYEREHGHELHRELEDFQAIKTSLARRDVMY